MSLRTARLCEHGKETAVFLKDGEIIDQMSDS